MPKYITEKYTIFNYFGILYQFNIPKSLYFNTIHNNFVPKLQSIE